MKTKTLALFLVGAPMATLAQGTDVELGLQLTDHEVRTGEALELTLTLDNTTTDLLVDVEVDLELRDASGVLVTDRFTLPTPSASGIAALDGSASLAPGVLASGTWALTPDHDLAGGAYTLTATVAAVLEGDPLQRALPARALRIVPAAELEVELYLPPRVHGDWSATPSLFEAAEPFPVGLHLANLGGGAALGLALDSSGPSFVPDSTGAATGASVLELELDGVVLPAGFGLDASQLGGLTAGGERRLLWTASPYLSADVTGMGLALVYADELEGPFLEPVVSLVAHDLVHAAEVFDVVAGPLDDDEVDWLVDDPAVAAPIDPVTGVPMEDFPDLVHMSAGPDLTLIPVTAPTLGPVPTHGNLVSTVEFTASVGGWHVLRFDAPGGAYFDLAQVVRTAKAAHLSGLTVGGPADVSRVWVTERPLDVTGDGIPDVTRRLVHVVDHVSTPGLVRYDLVHLPSTEEALSADTELLAAATGGTQTLALDAGPTHGGSDFVMLGTLSGTWPGFVLGGVTIPLNLDAYFVQTLTSPSSTTMIGGLGQLDPLGRATVQVVVPTGFPAGVGLTAHHAFVVFPPALFPITLASNPVPLYVLP